jgi:DNA-binding LacI/PurR family transcriptional regulator
MGTSSVIKMQDVANIAGVSCATVSRALKGDPRISARTKQKVLLAVKQLGYKHNPLLSDLMAKVRTPGPNACMGTLAFINTHSTSDDKSISTKLIRRLLAGATARAEQYGYRIEEFRLSEQNLTSKRALDILKARGIRGLVIAPAIIYGQSLGLDCSDFAVAAIGHSMRHLRFNIAVSHQYNGMFIAITELRKRGYRRIGLIIDGDQDERTNHSWSSAYLYLQQELEKNERIEMLKLSVVTKEDVYRWFLRSAPDAIVSPLIPVPIWLNEIGASIPFKVGFATLHHLASPNCAGIDQCSELVASEAVDLVFGQLYRNEHGHPKNPKIALVEGKWMDGPTVRCLAQGNLEV